MKPALIKPKPISEIPKTRIRGIFSDLDDTMTEKSLLPSSVVHRIESLKSKQYFVGIVSGRPAGWADCLMRLFPLDAMVFENGAGLMRREGNKILTENLAPLANYEEQQSRLRVVFESLKKEIPHLKLATDQPYRLFDFAIDFIEEEPHLTQKELNRVLQVLSEQKEITHKLSSIHVNYWCGSHTKVTAIEYFLAKYGKQWDLTEKNLVFSGDSPNDEPLFEYFSNSVGVANVQKYLPDMKNPPKFITKSESSLGFIELSDLLLN